MRKILTALFLLVCVSSIARQEAIQPVNAVLKDQSYIAFMGVPPDENTPEQLRIQIHLQYVENLLRQRDITNLSAEQQHNRLTVLDLLHTYWTLGVFPNNYGYPNERRPCFIDRDGNICAVGYLIRETAGAAVANSINEQHQYDYITDMQEDIIIQWATTYGLTVEECAMIQPSYWNQTTPVHQEASVTKGYGISSGVLGGTNLAITVLNLSGQHSGSKAVAYVGLATGAANIILGITNFKKNEIGSYMNGPTVTTSYKAQNNLSYVNVAMGTTTVLTSAFNLLMHRKERKNVISLYSSPGMNNSLNMGLAFTKRI